MVGAHIGNRLNIQKLRGEFGLPQLGMRHTDLLFRQSMTRGNTTADGYQIEFNLGDSISFGTNNTGGPGPSVPVLGSVQEWDGARRVNITNSDLAGVNTGSPWPQCGIDIYNNTGIKTIFVNSGSPGAEFYPNGDTNNFYTPGGGTKYEEAKAKLYPLLNVTGLEYPANINIILGINDARGTQLLTDIDTGINWLLMQIMKDFPKSNINLMLPGRSEATDPSTTRIQYIRKRLLQMRDAYSNIHVVGSLAPYVAWGLYGGDSLHPSQPGNNMIGTQFARYRYTNLGYPKYLRTIFNAFKDPISLYRKNLISWFTQSVDWSKVDCFYNFWLAGSKENAAVDWSMTTGGGWSGYTYNPSGGISFNGTTSEYFRTNFYANGNFLASSASDIFVQCKAVVANTPAGTAAYLFGATDTLQQIRLLQGGGSTLGYGCNDLTASTYATDTKIQGNTRYGVGRSGSPRFLWKNGSQVATASIAVVNALARDMFIGGLNSAGASATPWSGEVSDFAVTPYSIDKEAFNNNLNTLQTLYAS